MLCYYGCGKEAEYFLGKKGIPCCSKSHNGCAAIKLKQKNSLIMNTGYDSPSRNPATLEKRKQTCQERYGGSAPACSPKVQEKMQNTTKRLYGRKNVFEGDEGRELVITSIQKKFGSSIINVSQVPGIRNKMKATFLKNYGYDEILASPETHKKIQQTVRLKYGVDFIMHDPTWFKKAQMGRFAKRSVIIEGYEFMLQGFEEYGLRDLLKSGLKPSEIIHSPTLMPVITYFWGGKTRRYYPDFYVPKYNWLFEVKSRWTLRSEWGQNMAKREAAKRAGFSYSILLRQKSSSSSKSNP